MATVPDLDDLKAYLDAAGVSYDPPVEGGTDPVESALNAEVLNQLGRVTLPTVLEGDPAVEVPTYTDDLLEALHARVARRLVLRGLPLGVSPTATDSAIAVTRVGGLDAEVGRLEAPHRKVVLG